MSTIVAGHFQIQDQVEQARIELVRAGFQPDQISSFYLSQPGQHDATPIGGDNLISPGAKETPEGVVEGWATGGAVGAAVGLATAPLTGPAGPIIGGLVGAHVGSLFSLTKMKDAGEGEAGGAENQYVQRHAGMIIAVAFEKEEDEQRALEVLQRLGADQIERARGRIQNGDWTDFDASSLPNLYH